jgi:hypothetical protein
LGKLSEFFLFVKLLPDKSFGETTLSLFAVLNNNVALLVKSIESIEKLFSEVINEVKVSKLVINFIISEVLFDFSLGALELGSEFLSGIKEARGFLS